MTDSQIAVRQTNLELIRSIDDLLKLGSVLVKSKLLPNAINTPEAAAAVILKGRELNIGAMEACSSINIIQGKPTVSPQLMIALARRTKELEDLKISDDGNACTCVVKRKGQSPITTSFSMEDAEKMGLLNKDNWRKQPKTMRQWRAVGANFRVSFADAVSGLYLYEEMGAEVDEDGNLVKLPDSIEGSYTVDTKSVETPRGVERAVNKETGEITETDPFPPDFGDRPVVLQRKAEVVQAIVEHEQKHDPKPPMRTAPMSNNQLNKLRELYNERFGGTQDEIDQGLDAVFESAFKHPMSDASLAEASKVISQMIAQKKGNYPKSEPNDENLGSVNAAELIAKAQTLKDESGDPQKVVAEIKEAGRKFHDAGKLVEEVDKKTANHLAAIVGKAFATQPEETQRQARHAVYSYVRGAAIEGADKLYYGMAMAMIARWGAGDEWTVNHLGAFEIPMLLKAYQKAMGQIEMPLGGK